MSRRISAGERPGAPVLTRASFSSISLVSFASSIACSGTGGAPALSGFRGDPAGEGGDQQEDRGVDEVAGPDVAVEELFAEQPGDPVQDQDQRQEGEDAGGDADGGAAEDLADFLGDLGLGELDLLADQRRGVFGDLDDEVGERAVLRRRWRSRRRNRGRVLRAALASLLLLRRVFVVDAAVDERRDPGGGDARQRAGRGQQAAPDETFDHLVIH